jgi:hypothetical protein
VAGFRSILNEAKNNEKTFLKVFSAVFEKDMKSAVNPRGFSVHFKVKSFNR